MLKRVNFADAKDTQKISPQKSGYFLEYALFYRLFNDI